MHIEKHPLLCQLLQHRDTRSLVVGTLYSEKIFSRIKSKKLSAICHLLELRVDSFQNPFTEIPLLHHPTILTLRDPREGGKHPLSIEEKMMLMETHLSTYQFCDVEIANLKPMKEALHFLKLHGKTLLASYHNLEKTPSFSLLEDQIQYAHSKGAAVIKVATQLHTLEDISTLSQLLEQNRNRLSLSVMGLGTLSRASRLFFAQLGSILNYGYLSGTPPLKEHWSSQELMTLLSLPTEKT